MTQEKGLLEWLDFKTFGDIVKYIRFDILNQNLSTFCKSVGISPQVWSCIERNLKQVQDDELDKFMDYVMPDFKNTILGGIVLDLSKLEVQDRQFNTEEEVLSMLPIFVDINGHKPTKQELQSLIESLKSNW